MKKKFLFLLIGLLFNGVLFSQTNVKIIDLTVIQQITEIPDEEDSQTLKVEFKIKNVDNADKAYVLFGATEEGSEILQAEASFSQTGETYFLEYNNDSHEVKGYSAEVFIHLTDSQHNAYQYLTLYVLDKDGVTTQKLKLEK